MDTYITIGYVLPDRAVDVSLSVLPWWQLSDAVGPEAGWLRESQGVGYQKQRSFIPWAFIRA